MKLCKDCKQVKPLSEFYKDRGGDDGHRKNCKACKNTQVFVWRSRKSDEWNAYMRKYRKTHPQSDEDRERNYSRVLKSRYGIILSEYNELKAKQKGRCALCLKAPKNKRRLVVDHNHKTKTIRGLLCDGCNVAIAILDNPILYSKAKDYLNFQ